MFKILIVEDDRELNRTVCTFLNNNGYTATGCLSADEAYDTMYETVFDLIISDIMMPDIDGFEFAKTVRSLNNEIPILLTKWPLICKFPLCFGRNRTEKDLAKITLRKVFLKC